MLNLTTRQVRTTLVVLVQHHLVYHATDENDQTYYSANGLQAYNVCFRIAKTAKWAEDRYGKAASKVILKLSTLGHAKVEDLEAAFGLSLQMKPNITAGKKRTFTDAMDESYSSGPRNGTEKHDLATNGEDLSIVNSNTSKSKKSPIRSISQLHYIISLLLRDGFLMKVTEYQFLTDYEIAHEAESEILRRFYPIEGPKGTKEKGEFRARVRSLKAKWRDEANNILDMIDVKESATRNGTGGRGSSIHHSIPQSEDGFRLKVGFL